MSPTEEIVKMQLKDELTLAELQTPGHKASHGPGDTIVLTPVAERAQELRINALRQSIAGRAKILGLLEDGVA